LRVHSGDFEKAVAPSKLTTKVFNAGPSLIEALNAGNVDIGYVGPGPALNGFITSSGKMVRVIAGYVAVNALAAGLRTVSRSAALRRSLGRSDGWLRGVHLTVPVVGALIFVVATAWAGRSFVPVFDLALAVGLSLAVLRSATRPPMVYDTAWLVTPLGVVPVGLITQIIRGPDLAVVLALLFAYVIR